MGMLAAVEVWKGRYDLQGDYRTWEGWYEIIRKRLASIEGVRTAVVPPAGASPYPVLDLSWDPARIALTADEIGRKLLDGEPRIMSHAEGDGYGFQIRPVAMQPGEAEQVAARLGEILGTAPKPGGAALEKPAADISGDWEVALRFVAGEARHKLRLQVAGNSISGTHSGARASAPIRGTVEGNRVKLASSIPCHGTRLNYTFRGRIESGRMSGEADLGEYSSAQWTAARAGA